MRVTVRGPAWQSPGGVLLLQAHCCLPPPHGACVHERSHRPMDQVTSFNRRLAAIAFADVAGWSLQIARDDAATLQAWKTLRAEVLEPLVLEHHGQLLEVQGDAVLVEFASAVAAINWALEVQRDTTELAAQHGNAGLKLRIGVNVEDVIVDEGKLIGDGVNIASRIHQTAAAGEIIATENVRDFVRNKTSAAFVDLGAHQLKNISRPIHVFRVEALAAGTPRAAETQPLASWSKRPAIAVLPFRTQEGSSSEAYFGEGITENIIGALSRSHTFFVIARNSTLRYRDPQPDLREVARELGVRYILQGSVRRSDARLRITGELIDTTTLAAVWTEKFDGSDDDIFDFQDRIAASIVGMLEPRLMRVEVERALQKPTDSLDAYDCVLRALALIYQFETDGFNEAGRLLQRATELDPRYAQAHAWLAWWYNMAAGEGRSRDPLQDRQRAERAASRAIALDPDDAFCLAVTAHVRAFLQHKLEEAAEMFDRAVLLNENSAFAWGVSASTYCFLGRPEDALDRLRNAWRLSPFDPMNFFFWTVAGIAEFVAERYGQAIAWLRRAQRANPRFIACSRTLVASLAMAGEQDDAEQEASRLLALEPGFRVSTFASWYPLHGPGHMDRFAQGLRTAGLPE